MKRPAALPASPSQDASHSIEGDNPMVEPVPVPIRSSQRDQLREERLEILRLLEAGTVTTDEAATLLDALDRASLPPPDSGSTNSRSAEARLIRIRVTDSTTGRAVVNLAFPLRLIKSG